MADEVPGPGGPLPFLLRIPFVESLGLELWQFGGGSAELRVNIRDDLQNSWGVAHGGVLMTLLDVAMAQASRSAVMPELAAGQAAPGMVTIEMKTSFMRPAEGRLRATGELLHRTPTLAFTEGRVFDEQGRLCAHASGTFKYLAGLPVSGHDARRLQQRHTDSGGDG